MKNKLSIKNQYSLPDPTIVFAMRLQNAVLGQCIVLATPPSHLLALDRKLYMYIYIYIYKG